MSEEGGPLRLKGSARFELTGRLGEGGMGVVYEAFDRERGIKVALKTLRFSDPSAMLRFKNEFRALHDVQHTNLVSLGELHEQEGEWFFTMELVEGVGFLHFVRPEPEGRDPESATSRGSGEESTRDFSISEARPEAPLARPGHFDEVRLRDVLRQLVAGVQALHSAGKVHRDLKPSNVMVTPEGRVVILDFGIVTELTWERVSAETGVVVGTSSYMAPEQAAGKAVGTEADWYSVGVMLYRALTGRLPFIGTESEVMVQKQLAEPPPPSALVEGIPADLDALCVGLLAIDPSLRLRGPQILKALGHEEAGETSRSGGFAAPFVGRHPELEELSRALSEVTSHGATVTVLVEGQSGVGKTALVRRFTESLRRGRDPGEVAWLAGRCHERESVPFKGVDGVIDALTHHLTGLAPAVVAPLLPPDIDLLCEIFPVLRQVTALTARVPVTFPRPDPVQVRQRAFAALRELLVRLGQSRVLVLGLDDLQWTNADSLLLLETLLQSPGAPRLLLIATVRPSLEAYPFLRMGAGLGPDLRRLEVSTLESEAAEGLAALLLERAGLGPEALTIAREASGHPLFIQELVRLRQLSGNQVGPLHLDDALRARAAPASGGAEVARAGGGGRRAPHPAGGGGRCFDAAGGVHPDRLGARGGTPGAVERHGRGGGDRALPRPGPRGGRPGARACGAARLPRAAGGGAGGARGRRGDALPSLARGRRG
jgi:serine/threonine protein kinase